MQHCVHHILRVNVMHDEEQISFPLINPVQDESFMGTHLQFFNYITYHFTFWGDISLLAKLVILAKSNLVKKKGSFK